MKVYELQFGLEVLKGDEKNNCRPLSDTKTFHELELFLQGFAWHEKRAFTLDESLSLAHILFSAVEQELTSREWQFIQQWKTFLFSASPSEAATFEAKVDLAALKYRALTKLNESQPKLAKYLYNEKPVFRLADLHNLSQSYEMASRTPPHLRFLRGQIETIKEDEAREDEAFRPALNY